VAACILERWSDESYRSLVRTTWKGSVISLNLVWQIEGIEPFGPEPAREECSRVIGRRLTEEIATGQAA
jgi:hypothetical protein